MVKLVLVAVPASNQPCVQSTSITIGKRLCRKRGRKQKGKDVSMSEEAASGLLKGSLGSDH